MSKIVDMEVVVLAALPIMLPITTPIKMVIIAAKQTGTLNIYPPQRNQRGIIIVESLNSADYLQKIKFGILEELAYSVETWAWRTGAGSSSGLPPGRRRHAVSLRPRSWTGRGVGSLAMETEGRRVLARISRNVNFS